MFQIYTYFGRVISTHKIPDTETHHDTLERARQELLKYERETGNPAWVRYIR